MSKKTYTIWSVILAIVIIALAIISATNVFNFEIDVVWFILAPGIALIILNGVRASSNKNKKE